MQNKNKKNMKAGYKIENYNCKNPDNILVQNIDGINKVLNVGFYGNIFSNVFTVGFWRIKYKI